MNQASDRIGNMDNLRIEKPDKLGLSELYKEIEKPRLMLFDLSIYGHHPGYIRYLIQHWYQQKLPGNIIILVSPKFLEEHSDVVIECQEFDHNHIHFLAISVAEEAELRPRSSGLNRNIRNFQEWQLFCKYARELEIDHALLMYYDTYQYPLALNISKLPCPVSGIYFRPTFHYKYFPSSTLSLKEKRQQLWERFVLNRVLNNTNVHTLFSLDPFVVSYVGQGFQKHKIINLADPVKISNYNNNCLDNLKKSLEIERDRKICLLFGALTDRKGIYELLKAIPFLDTDVCRQLTIILVGEADPSNRQRIDKLVDQVLQSCPIQIVRHYEFIPDEDVQKYFQISDLILAPYQRHVGMSGILILAATAQKPVLSSNYGLMGELIRRYRLGLAVDTTAPKNIAQGLTQFLSMSEDEMGDRLQMKKFAEQNSSDIFAEVIFTRLNDLFPKYFC